MGDLESRIHLYSGEIDSVLLCMLNTEGSIPLEAVSRGNLFDRINRLFRSPFYDAQQTPISSVALKGLS